MNKKLTTYLMLVGTSILWGSSFVFSGAIFQAEPLMTPMILVAGRLLVASVFFSFFFFLTGMRPQRVRKKHLRLFFGFAALQPFLYFMGETYGIIYSTPTVASVVVASIPVFIPFAVHFAFKEKLRYLSVVGACISLFGILLMTYSPGVGFEFQPQGLFFLFMAVTSAIFYSIILQRVLKVYKPHTIVFYQNLIGFLYFIPMILIFDRATLPQIHFSLPVCLYISILGIFCSVIAYILFNKAVRNFGIAKASMFENAIPAVTLILVTLLGIEAFSIKKLIGLLIVVGGVSLSQASRLFKSKKNPTPSTTEWNH